MVMNMKHLYPDVPHDALTYFCFALFCSLVYEHKTVVGATYFFFIFSGGGVNKELNNIQSQKGETPGGDTSCFTH